MDSSCTCWQIITSITYLSFISDYAWTHILQDKARNTSDEYVWKTIQYSVIHNGADEDELEVSSTGCQQDTSYFPPRFWILNMSLSHIFMFMIGLLFLFFAWFCIIFSNLWCCFLFVFWRFLLCRTDNWKSYSSNSLTTNRRSTLSAEKSHTQKNTLITLFNGFFPLIFWEVWQLPAVANTRRISIPFNSSSSHLPPSLWRPPLNPPAARLCFDHLRAVHQTALTCRWIPVASSRQIKPIKRYDEETNHFHYLNFYPFSLKNIYISQLFSPTDISAALWWSRSVVST